MLIAELLAHDSAECNIKYFKFDGFHRPPVGQTVLPDVPT